MDPRRDVETAPALTPRRRGFLAGAGKTVTAIIDVGDFRDLRGNASHSPAWNGSRYHDLAVHLSVLIQEQILTRDPTDFSPDEIHIRRPADRLGQATAWWLAAARSSA
jgi:hypothetical protein